MQHPALYTGPSAVHGTGVFAKRAIPAQKRLCVYSGTLLSEPEYWQAYPSGFGKYVVALSDNLFVDGARNSIASYINDVRGTGLPANCALFTQPDQVLPIVYSTRPLAEDEELLLDYGADYWVSWSSSSGSSSSD